jgi:sporulation protein YlmC with PRC-barrel domain
MKGLVRIALVAALVGTPVGAAVAQQPPSSPTPSSGSPTPPPPQQQPAPSSPQPQASGQPAGLTVASDSLVGTKVRDGQGKEIGEISKLLIDVKQGKVTSALIKQGGSALGLGGKEISVPWESLALQRGQNQELVATLQQPLLEQAPSASPPSGDQERKQK